MYLKKLDLLNFRSYREVRVAFDQGVQCLLGKNGSGKTNLLDAVHYLSFTKTSLAANDAQNVRDGEDSFSIRGIFERNGLDREVACSYNPGRKKSVSENGKDYEKLSEHIGKYPVVLVAPNDIELIWDGGEIRRKFFDTLISQVNREYLAKLISYTGNLKMRNSLLHLFAERGKVDDDLLESCDRQLILCADFIAQVRTEFTAAFIPVFALHYQALSGGMQEPVTILYESEATALSMEELLKRNRQRDLAMQRTTGGVHRDDFVFALNNAEIKRFGSQGQQKSFLMALKLTEFDVISRFHGFKPILLLDDVFDKLDDDRIAALIRLVSNGAFGQLFITDARPDRSRQLLSSAGIRATQFGTENGNLARIS